MIEYFDKYTSLIPEAIWVCRMPYGTQYSASWNDPKAFFLLVVILLNWNWLDFEYSITEDSQLANCMFLAASLVWKDIAEVEVLESDH